MDTEYYDLTKALRAIASRAWLIFVSALAGLGISLTITVLFIPRLYSADVLLYIGQENGESLTASDLNLFSQLVNDYKVMIKSRLVTRQIAEELQLSSGQARFLSNQITIRSESNTRHIIITATDQNPQMVALIANKTAGVFASTVTEKIGRFKAQVIDAAIEPTEPSSPDLKRNGIAGLLLGACLSALIILMISYLDTSVRTAGEARTITGCESLGAVPAMFWGKAAPGKARRA